MSADANMTPHSSAHDAFTGGHLDVDAILEDYRRRQMIEQLTGPVVSVLVHMVVLVICFFFLVGNKTKEEVAVEVNIKDLKVNEMDQKVEQKIQEIERQQDVVPVVEKPEIENETVTDEISDVPIDTPEQANLLEVSSFNSPLKLSGIYGARLAHGAGGTDGSGYGGNIGATKESESAILKALRWMKGSQRPDGSIAGPKGEYPCAMTGLALLAFLGHGETPDSPEFGTTVSNAIQFLCTQMSATKDGAILENQYSHGIVVYALSEAYSMTQLPFIKGPMEKGLKTIIAGQQETGGWDYGYRKVKKADEKELRFDMSVAGWQIQALKAGHIAEANVPGLSEALEKAITFLQKQAFDKKKGSFQYSQGLPSISMQGAGSLCLQMLGEGKSDQVKTAIKAIEGVKVLWNNPKRGSVALHANDCYAWYYQTQAMFYAGNSKFAPWNKQFSPELIKNQKPGPATPDGKATGYWDPPPPVDLSKYDRADCDKVYTTALSCLMLEVYYRFLPSYKVDIREAPKAEEGILDL